MTPAGAGETRLLWQRDHRGKKRGWSGTVLAHIPFPSSSNSIAHGNAVGTGGMKKITLCRSIIPFRNIQELPKCLDNQQNQ